MASTDEDDDAPPPPFTLGPPMGSVAQHLHALPLDLNGPINDILRRLETKLCTRYAGGAHILALTSLDAVATWVHLFAGLMANELKQAFQRFRKHMACEVCGARDVPLHTCHRQGRSRHALVDFAFRTHVRARADSVVVVDIQNVIRTVCALHHSTTDRLLFFLCPTHHHAYDWPDTATASEPENVAI